MPPHSKTVRGTLDNPKTKAILQNENKSNSSPTDSTPSLQNKSNPRTAGDQYGYTPSSQGPSSKDSAPQDSIADQGNKRSERTAGDQYGYTPDAGKGNDGVKGGEANRTMLGDATSMVSETGGEGKGGVGEKSMQDAATERAEYSAKRGSKL